MPYICQHQLPFSPWMKPATSRLPGVQLIKSDGCFLMDEVFQLQMHYRDYLLSEKFNQVYINEFLSTDECAELLEFVVGELKQNEEYTFNNDTVIRPDGVELNLLSEDPLLTASRLVQEDLLLLRKEGDEHILRAGVLCFPASWTLNEKKNKSLTDIHGPVEEYNTGLALRIEKMFSNMSSDTPIWRANFLLYDDYELFQPRLEKDEKGNSHKKLRQFLRVERQALKKISRSKNILFSIHTFVVPYLDLSSDQKETLESFLA
jgi:hypothetical protein